MSAVTPENVPSRIRVRRAGECVPLIPGIPALSSANSPWQGALLERHSHGPHTSDCHQHLSHFLCLHLSDAAPLKWRSRGRTGNIIIEPGAIVLISRGTQDAVSFPRPVRRLLLNLEPSVLDRAFPDEDTTRSFELRDQWGIQDPKIGFILRALEADAEAGFPAGGLFGESLLSALAVHLRYRYGVMPPKGFRPKNGLPPIRLRRVLDYIEANLDRSISLGALANTAEMSPHYFSELFKQSLEVSPHQFVLRRRIDRARKLLRDPAVSVLEAAVRTGFADQGHFTKIFRRVVGTTPSRYRAAL